MTDLFIYPHRHSAVDQSRGTRTPRWATCIGCGARFLTRSTRGKFSACSLECRLIGGVERRGIDECWPWQHVKDKDGYGEFWINFKKYRSHRATYQIAVGPIPCGMVVMHTCDHPPCCNPRHLRLGTAQDNNNDKVRKGRAAGARGIDAGNAKLDDDKVRHIRTSSEPAKALAARYGVKEQCIFKIRQGIRWRHVV